jgi:hypothetical protein
LLAPEDLDAADEVLVISLSFWSSARAESQSLVLATRRGGRRLQNAPLADVSHASEQTEAIEKK